MAGRTAVNAAAANNPGRLNQRISRWLCERRICSGVARSYSAHEKVTAALLATVIALAGAVIAANELLGVSNDRSQYDLFFSGLRNGERYYYGDTRFEAGFTYVATLLVNIGASNDVIYGVFVFIAFFPKLFIISLRSRRIAISAAVMVFYFTRFFPMFELTILRSACAAGMLVLAFHFVEERQIVKGLIFSALAIFFHNSALIVAPLLFMPVIKLRYIILLCIMLFALLTVYIDELLSHLIGSVESISYYQHGAQFLSANLLAPSMSLDIALLPIVIIFLYKHTFAMLRALYMQMFATAFALGAIKYSVFAFRLRDTIAIFLIFYLVDALHDDDLRYPAMALIALNSVIFTYAYFFYGSVHLLN